MMLREINVTSLEKTDNDMSIGYKVKGILPLLTLTDDFINRNKIKENIVTNVVPTDIVYTGDKEYDFILSVTGLGRVNNSIYYDSETKSLININCIRDLDSEIHKGTKIKVNGYEYGKVSNGPNAVSNIALMSTSQIGYIAEPITVPASFKVIELNVPNLSINTNVTKVKDVNDIEETLGILSVVELDYTSLNLDSYSELHTIYSMGNGYFNMINVPVTSDLESKIDKIYIPIL